MTHDCAPSDRPITLIDISDGENVEVGSFSYGHAYAYT